MEKIKHYQLLELIREDEVFKEFIAYCSLEKKLVRIKILQEKLKENEKFIADLRRILQVAILFSHKNIMKIINFAEDRDIFYIVEEYQEGEYLDKIIKTHPSNSICQDYIFQIAEGIKYLEEKNLIHGGISSASIWITKKGEVKITNFGIILLIQQSSEKIFSLYNVNYIPPEQIISERCEKTSDIFASGTLFLEMLTGSPKGEPLNEFAEIINKSRNKNVNLRYQNISELIDDLKSISKKSISLEEKEMKKSEEVEKIIRKRTQEIKEREVKKKPKKNEVYSCFLIFFVFLLILSFSIWFVYTIISPPAKEVIVPDVIGKNLKEAEEILKNNSLKINIMGKEYSDKFPENTVISQAPLPGVKRKEGKIINLILSLGTEKITVPDVRNLKLREAKIALEEAKLKIGKEEYTSSDVVSEDCIIEQEPLSGIQVSKNTAVNLIISTGPEKIKVEVPDLKGMGIEEAKQMLPSVNLKTGVIKKIFKSDVPEGIIINQQPQAGTTVEANTPINIIVSAGPKPNEYREPKKEEEESKEADVVITVPLGASKQQVKIIVIDSKGVKTVYQKIHSPGDEVKVPVRGVGNTTVQVFIAGELVKEEQL